MTTHPHGMLAGFPAPQMRRTAGTMTATPPHPPSPETAPSRPVLDFSRFRQLADDLDSPEAAVKFAVTYRGLLPARVNRILSALTIEDPDAALDAILSLKITSAMTGAAQMEHNCLRLQDELRAGTPLQALAATTPIARDTPPLMAALQELLQTLANPN